MIAIALALASSAGDFHCGTQVVSGTGKTLPLYARTGEVVVELPIKDDSLAEPLPIMTCGSTMVLVRYHDQMLRADMWQVVTDQNIDLQCSGHAGGSVEQRTSARTMNGLTAMVCKAPADAPASTAAAVKRKAHK